MAAAQAKYEAGALDDALALLVTAETRGVDDLQRARVDLLRAQIAFAVQRGGDAPTLLLEAARALEAVDPDRARTTFLEALEAARFAGRLASGADVVEVSRAALAGPAPRRPPRPTDLLLEGMATLIIDGHAAGVPILKAALSAFREQPVLPPEESRWLSFACRAASDLWDEESWRLLATRELQRARDAGALTAMPLFLSTLSFIHALCGELSVAESLLDEIARPPPRRPASPPIATSRSGSRRCAGGNRSCWRWSRTSPSDAKARGEGFALGFAGQAGAVLYNGLGRYEEAFAAVREAVDVAPYSELSTPSTVAELVEAAARAGERRIAERALERLTVSTRPSGSDWALGIEARSRALLSDGDAAERLYQEAIERLRRTRVRVQLARPTCSMASGCGASGVASTPATSCAPHSSCSRAWASRRSPRAPSVSCWPPASASAKRRIETREQLTAQETQIARLARDGLSNAAIGERLFISQHTVAYHLRKVFTKLDITSRHQLGRVLPDSMSPVQVA